MAATAFVLALLPASPVAGQALRPLPAGLGAVLIPGATVWITDAAGREEKVRVAEVSGDAVSGPANGAFRAYRLSDLQRVRVRAADPLWNGALIGAGVAVASGLLLCRTMEPWDNCRDDVGPMLRIGAVGAGIGLGIDALIRGRKTVYEAAPRATRLVGVPFVARGVAGLQMSVSF